jgi:hypothetical protein
MGTSDPNLQKNGCVIDCMSEVAIRQVGVAQIGVREVGIFKISMSKIRTT